MSHRAPQRNGVSLQWKRPISGFAELTSNQINSFHYTSYGFFRSDSQNAKKNVYIFWLRHQMWDRCANCFLLLFVPRFHSVHLRGQWLDVQRIKASPVSWWALKSTPTLNWCNCAIICTHHFTAKKMLSPSTRQTNTQTLWPTNSPSASALGKLLKWKNRNFLKFLRESIASSQKNASQWVLFAVSGWINNQTAKLDQKTTAEDTCWYEDDDTDTYGVRDALISNPLLLHTLTHFLVLIS